MIDSAETPSDAMSGRADRQADVFVRSGLVLRHLNLIAVGCSFIGALCMCLVGLLKTWLAATTLITGMHESDEMAAQVTSYVVQAMDSFLIAMVLVVFATGIFHLFIKQLDHGMLMRLGGFRLVTSITDLKRIIAELIIIVLFVQFLKLAIDGSQLQWEILVIPAGIVLMAVAMKLLKMNPHHQDG